MCMIRDIDGSLIGRGSGTRRPGKRAEEDRPEPVAARHSGREAQWMVLGAKRHERQCIVVGRCNWAEKNRNSEEERCNKKYLLDRHIHQLVRIGNDRQ